MAKFNQPRPHINTAGGEAQALSIKERVATQVLTSFFGEEKYYGDNSLQLVQDVRVLLRQDPAFIASLAIYAKEQMLLRSVPHMLVAELAAAVKGESYVSEVIYKTITRPDDMKEVLAYYLTTFEKPIPNSLKKGLARAFCKFDEYSLAKYNGGKQRIKLKDILCLVHPHPQTPEQSKVWKRVLTDTLAVPTTWETSVSKRGNRREVWEELIWENKLGYMAMLRNLRNIINSGAENLPLVLERLSDPKAVKSSKQTPFRFLSAYRSVNHSEAQVALETALSHSVSNLPRIEGATFWLADNSGSMGSSLSKKSLVSYGDVANLLLAIGGKICQNSIAAVFGTGLAVLGDLSEKNVLQAVQEIRMTHVGHATNLHLGLEYLLRNKVFVDRIVVLSDMQTYAVEGHRNILAEYRQTVNPNVWVHSVDLAGYGFAPVELLSQEKVSLLAGWSEKILTLIPLVEQNKTALIQTIQDYYKL